MIGLRLAKAGYGTPMGILSWPSEVVLSALEYEKFTNDYEAAFVEINKDKPCA